MAAKTKVNTAQQDATVTEVEAEFETGIAPIVAETETVKLPKVKIRGFRIWIVGDTPIICHAWSEKARREMLGKQQKETSEGRAIRDPKEDYDNSLYEMGDGHFGFPAMAVKKAMLEVAHKDRGVPRATMRGALWLQAQMVKTRPALSGAVCDMPLLRIYGSEPELREDMVRVGVGLNKKASLAYRAQFKTWALLVRGRVNTSICPIDWIPFCLKHSGLSVGLGDWRNEKNGMFGSFHIANEQEEADWNRFMTEGGPVPEVVPFGGDPDFLDEEEELKQAAD